MSDFAQLNLLSPIQSAIRQIGYQTPTPIQIQAIPPLLEGRDLLGIAQTGTGKTAAFALPILHRLAANRRRAGPRGARSLILTPTRELASQIEESFRTFGKNLSMFRALIFGGVGQTPQVRAMSRGVDILVATPGRLLDLMEQGHVRLDALEVFVLDEADRMLDMGFIHDIRKVIAKLPPDRQTMLFSATMPAEIAVLAEGLLKDPARVEVAPQATTVERVEQKVLFVDKADKRKLLRSLLEGEGIQRALVFTRTKHGADRVVRELETESLGGIAAIHGNKSQSAREKALGMFRTGEVRVLVATDIAARGIDVPGISHVINYDLPNEPESYVHRIGRTARAGAGGMAISFCDVDERPFLRDIERVIRQEVSRDLEHPFHCHQAAASTAKAAPMPMRGRGGASGFGGNARGGQGHGGASSSKYGSSHGGAGKVATQPSQRGAAQGGTGKVATQPSQRVSAPGGQGAKMAQPAQRASAQGERGRHGNVPTTGAGNHRGPSASVGAAHAVPGGGRPRRRSGSV